ncbi:TPM domain-containing protein [Dyella psychrodurans]|uniref:YgcG family protein n=1 Tax=Dyella psychrodurans TaxID=1927960 RepID=A0A370XAM4_9GAMM|nr:YgcG family protein [Dyella psychrodurans]RDS85438.1 YgcG family protein [Dyella psychrodurans]
MMRRCLRLWMVLAIALLSPWTLSHADDQPAVPTLTRHVTDLTGTLTPQQVDQLDAQLTNLEKQKGAQLVVLMVGTTQPDDIEDYSLRVAEANKLGRKGVDDGVLLFIAKNDRQVRIEVGYGLEGAIPDAACARIIREYMAPKFRNNDYAGGINDAVGALTQLINGEPLPPPVHGNDVEQHGQDLHGLFFFGIFALVFMRGIFGRTSAFVRAPLGAIVIGGLCWLVASLGIGILGALIGGIFMLIPAGAGRSIGGGGWGGFGGWGGGGFGGGGFGGGGGGFSGGGGSFGGGGASGNW